MRNWDEYLRRDGLLIVLSGPSGVGKDAVLAEFQKIHPAALKCVTTTTRAPREGEVDGVDYTFISVEEFRNRVENEGFLEYATVHGNLYGTPRAWVEWHRGQGSDVVLKIDVQGGLAVKKQMPDAVMIFLAPPSLEELERRLRTRSTETEAEATRRLLDARKELEEIPHYDYIIENDTLCDAAEQLRAVIIAEHCRIRK